MNPRVGTMEAFLRIREREKDGSLDERRKYLKLGKC